MIRKLSEADCRAMLAEHKALIVKSWEDRGNLGEYIIRRFPDIPADIVDESKAFLRKFGSANNTEPKTKVTDPLVSSEPRAGEWGCGNVWHQQDEEQRSADIYQVLFRGNFTLANIISENGATYLISTTYYYNYETIIDVPANVPGSGITYRKSDPSVDPELKRYTYYVEKRTRLCENPKQAEYTKQTDYYSSIVEKIITGAKTDDYGATLKDDDGKILISQAAYDALDPADQPNYVVALYDETQAQVLATGDTVVVDRNRADDGTVQISMRKETPTARRIRTQWTSQRGTTVVEVEHINATLVILNADTEITATANAALTSMIFNGSLTGAGKRVSVTMRILPNGRANVTLRSANEVVGTTFYASEELTRNLLRNGLWWGIWERTTFHTTSSAAVSNANGGGSPTPPSTGYTRTDNQVTRLGHAGLIKAWVQYMTTTGASSPPVT